MKNNKINWLIQGLCKTLMAVTLVISISSTAFAAENQQQYAQNVEQGGESVSEENGLAEAGQGTSDEDNKIVNADVMEQTGLENSENPADTDETYTEGWIVAGDKRHWQYADGTYACNTWIEDGGEKYYLDENGDLATNQWIGTNYVDEDGKLDSSVVWHEPGWKENSVGWWWQNEDGSYPTSCFKEIKGVTYYFDSNGYMAVGWSRIAGSWYYFRGSGSMVTGGWAYINGKWYYLDQTGVMLTGWQKINGQWYYLQGSGAMSIGWQRVGSSWYYLNNSGAMATNWVYVNNTWYYLRESGAMVVGWQMINGNWYYFQGSGAMSTGWQKVGSSWYYMNNSGAMLTGWLHIKNSWYYLSESGEMVTGWRKVGDSWYYFQESGVMAADTWVGSYYLTSSGAWDPSVAYDNIYTWPCPGYTRVSSDYGPRSRPTAGASSYHRGIDIAAPAGATVTSVHRGTVQSYGYNGTMGNYVKISHGNGVVSVYMHLSRIANIHTGMSVSAGTVIGYVGSTGVATGAHLHLGILLNGTYVSPWNYISRP